ncbi:thiamine pyrophosphokinase [Myxozyma melibiosi]|uniref:Thiamine pyrophosphokinase n=1 Tax=Myxozyma melibiosi TaxID=54550 RepID=A0ABR1F337_9ASCO
MPLTQEDIEGAVPIDRAAILLSPDELEKSGRKVKPYALIILNQPINDLAMLKRVWDNATVRACADGGANRLFHALDKSSRQKFKPDFIAGDLDSLMPEIREYYEFVLSVPIYHSPDQYSTDFGKCLVQLSVMNPAERLAIVALGGTGGRVDQEFHSYHTLFTHEVMATAEDDSDPTKRRREVTLLSDDSLTFLVPQADEKPLTAKIFTPRSVVGPTCGLIPILGPSVISIKGFTWDVEDWPTSFGTQVSTSNAMEGDEVYVKSDKTLIFTLEVRR